MSLLDLRQHNAIFNTVMFVAYVHASNALLSQRQKLSIGSNRLQTSGLIRHILPVWTSCAFLA